MASRTRSTLTASAAALALVAGAALTVASAAHGAPPNFEPTTDDPRATPHAGNATTCEDAGLAGEIIDVEHEGGVANVDQFLTITGTAGNVELTGIVVKGGPAYNVYDDAPFAFPLEDLRAPENKGGQLPTISHWFACGEAMQS